MSVKKIEERTVKQNPNRTHLPYFLKKVWRRKKLLDCLERNEKTGLYITEMA